MFPVVVKALDTLGECTEHFEARAREELVEVLAHLARGYHAYHLRDKVAHYQGARDALCSAAALLALLAGLRQGMGYLEQLATELQEDPLRGVANLIRTLESKRARRSPQPGGEEPSP